MTRCPVCKSEISYEVEDCPICGVEIREWMEETDEPEADPVVWALVSVVNTAIEAELIAGRLRANGIPAVVLSQVDSTRGLTVGALAVAKVFVPSQFAVKAEALLQSDPSEEGEIDVDDEQEGGAEDEDNGEPDPRSLSDGEY